MFCHYNKTILCVPFSQFAYLTFPECLDPFATVSMNIKRYGNITFSIRDLMAFSKFSAGIYYHNGCERDNASRLNDEYLHLV